VQSEEKQPPLAEMGVFFVTCFWKIIFFVLNYFFNFILILKINFKIIINILIYFQKKKLKNQPPPTTSQLRRKSLPRNLSKNMHGIYSKGWPTLSPLGRDEGKPNIININQSKSCVGIEFFLSRQDKGNQF